MNIGGCHKDDTGNQEILGTLSSMVSVNSPTSSLVAGPSILGTLKGLANVRMWAGFKCYIMWGGQSLSLLTGLQ